MIIEFKAGLFNKDWISLEHPLINELIENTDD